MADLSGRKIAYGIAKESVRGTAVTPAFWIPQLMADFQNNSDNIFNESVFGVLNKNSATEIIRDYATGKIDGKATDKTFPLILMAALGSISTASNADASGNVKDHTITQSQANTPQSFTLTKKDANSDKNYPLAMLKSLEITVVVGDFVKYTSDWISKKGVTGTDTVAYTLENEFKAKYATAKVATNTAGLGAALAIPLKSMKIKINRVINPYYVFGSNDPNEIFVEGFETTGEMVLRYTDQTYENLSFAATPQAVLLDLINTDVIIGTAANPRLKFTLPKMILDTWKMDTTKENVTEQTIGLRGLYDLASSSEISVVATNLQASY